MLAKNFTNSSQDFRQKCQRFSHILLQYVHHEMRNRFRICNAYVYISAY